MKASTAIKIMGLITALILLYVETLFRDNVLFVGAVLLFWMVVLKD